MKRNCFIIILFFVSISFLHSDFIIPHDDPVYSFLESMNNLGYTEKTFFIYPQYYNEITNILMELRTQDLPKQYQKLTEYHYERLSKNFPEGLNSDVYPLRKIPRSAINIFKSHSDKKRLLTYNKDDCSLFLSGMMGVNYDIKSNDEKYNRNYEYYGLEFGGNIKEDFGFFTQYRKGHYEGDLSFILENKQMHWSGGEPRLVTTCSEVDYKNNFLNFSIGYGSFKIGKTITSSIILNSDITSFGYLKYYKKFGNFHYIGINSQFLPDSLTSSSEYNTKSYAMQAISYNKDAFAIGFGQAVIYGDKTFDFAYSTPLVVFKLIDFKNYGRDNQVVFFYSSFRMFSGLVFFENFFMDDLKKKRLFTKEGFSGLASQTGLIYNSSNFPLQFTTEVTLIGPGTYGHSPQYYPQNQYTHDTQLLGYSYGANLLNVASEIMYFNSKLNVSLQYENLQQGSLGEDPFIWEAGNYDLEFLAGKISRTEKITTEIKYYPYPEISLHLKYEYQKREENNINYLYSGLEVRY